MTAYSFHPRFVDPIRVGLGIEPDIRPMSPLPSAKRQTIRKQRGGAGHADPGDILQLYCRQRCKDGYLIGEARCTETKPITLDFVSDAVGIDNSYIHVPDSLDAFARADGFLHWLELVAFWAQTHPGVIHFDGWLIRWEPRA